MYDEVLSFHLCEEVRVVGHADNIGVVMVIKHILQVVQIGNQAIRAIAAWM